MKVGTVPKTKVYILFENVLQYAGDETMAGVFATFESAVRKSGRRAGLERGTSRVLAYPGLPAV